MYNLFDFQKPAYEAAKQHDNFALFCKTGTGKTAITINILRYRYTQYGKILPTLILCPISACIQWKQEFPKFSKIPQEKILVLTGPGKERSEMLESFISRDDTGIIVVTNYEGLLIDKLYESLKRFSPSVIIADESHRIKDAGSLRSKKLYPLSVKAKHKYALTGTPFANSMLDAFGQFKFLDDSILGQNFFSFKLRYFYDRNAGMPKHVHFPDWQPRPGSAEELGKIIAKHSYQITECPGIPELKNIYYPVSMPSKQAKAYKDMEKDFVAEVDGRIIAAEFAMTKSMRMQQILAGFAPFEDGSAKWFEDLPRLQAVLDLVDSFGNEQFIIWTTFKPSYAKIAEALEKRGVKCAMHTGEETPKEKQKAIDDFKSGKVQGFISNPASGGESLNLQCAKYAIYYSKSYKLIEYEQSQARNHRSGSDIHDEIVHYHIFVPGTVDEVITQALCNKKDVAEEVLRWAREKR